MWNKLTVFWIIKITIPEERWWKTRLHRLFFLINFIVVVTYEYILSKKKREMICSPSQNAPIQWFWHPLSHLPVDLLQGDPSLQWPWQDTHVRFEIYSMSLQTETDAYQTSFFIVFLIMWRQSKASSSVCVRYFSWLSINPMSYIDH